MAYNWEKDNAQRRAKYVKSIEKDTKALERFIAKVKVPEGWVGELKDDHIYYAGDILTKKYVLTNSALEITLTFSTGGVGTTDFNTAQGWRTFDRRGVDSSFYWGKMEYMETLPFAEIVAQQAARVLEKRGYYLTAIKVPVGGGFTVSPERLEEQKRSLAKGGMISYAPAGFGTGYNVSKTKQYGYSTRASKELEAFFGVSPLYVSTFDHD